MLINVKNKLLKCFEIKTQKNDKKIRIKYFYQELIFFFVHIPSLQYFKLNSMTAKPDFIREPHPR